MDVWNARDNKQHGSQNFCVVWRRTDNQGSVAPDGMTQFWAMQSRKVGTAMPADAVIAGEFANNLCGLIVSEVNRKDLSKTLQKSGAMQDCEGQRNLQIDVLDRYFLDHAVVMRGLLPISAWPRNRRKLALPFGTMLCTCVEFLLHADCEHNFCAKALNKIRVDLHSLPVKRPQGRKRKHGEA
ncbi:unnamed protein product [Effrenium voratum]|uniref:Uncharacterized protein n=1 Tax=Effrenium voratum TaxID=2562239 RepID=A0AA36HZ71_9DINO|nr:unnamed protein product [Effrenium voratum]